MKPNTYTRLYVHCVFTPRGRESLMKQPAREQLQKYIYGIIKNKKCNPIAINGMDDHLHLLIGYNPNISISDLMHDIKKDSSLFANSNKLFCNRFSWQEGYGAFTVGYRELDNVFKYIVNQEEHHKSTGFRDEYIDILSENGIDDKDYLFEFYD